MTTPPVAPRAPSAPARLGRTGLLATLAGLLLAVGGASPAQAHLVRIVGPASNYQTDVRDVTPPVPGLSVRVLEAGNQLELSNRSGQEVVVLGYQSEPYLRVGPTGVYENRRSPSAYSNRFANPPKRIPSGLDAAAPPDWRRIANQPDAIWHDHRSHWPGPDPPAVTADPGHRQVVNPNWQIPLRLGQRTALIQGDIVWVPGPSAWPWILLAAAAFAVMLAAGWRSWYGLLALLVVVAVAADAFHTIGTFAASTAPLLTKAYASGLSVVAWVAAIAGVWQLFRRRLQAGRVLLLLAGTLLVFGSAFPDRRTLGSSQLVVTLDPALTRAGIALTLGLGLGMVAASLAGRRTARPVRRPTGKVA